MLLLNKGPDLATPSSVGKQPHLPMARVSQAPTGRVVYIIEEHESSTKIRAILSNSSRFTYNIFV